MVIGQAAPRQAQHARRSPSIDFHLPKDQPFTVTLEGDLLIFNQPLDVRTVHVQVARYLLDSKRAVRHNQQARARNRMNAAKSVADQVSSKLIARTYFAKNVSESQMLSLDISRRSGPAAPANLFRWVPPGPSGIVRASY